MQRVNGGAAACALTAVQPKDHRKTRPWALISSHANTAKRRAACTSDALVKLILRHWSCTFLVAKPPIELAACGYHSFCASGTFSFMLWTKRVSAPRASSFTSLLQDSEKKRGDEKCSKSVSGGKKLCAKRAKLGKLGCQQQLGLRKGWKRGPFVLSP